MKKFLTVMIMTAALFVVMVSTVSADRTLPLLVDSAGLLDTHEYERLLAELEDISERQRVEVAIVTVDSLEGRPVAAFTDDMYDYYGYGFGSGDDGVMLLVAMDEREWHISTHGFAVYALTDYGLSLIEDAVIDDLSDGWYYDAFFAFGERCDEFLTLAREGTPVDRGTYSEPFDVMGALVIAIIIGFVAGFVYVSSLKSSMKTVQSAENAQAYADADSLKLTRESDRFLYARTTRVARNTGSSGGGGSRTHRSSSGRSHGGRSGRF